MLPLSLLTPAEVARALAERVKTIRLQRGWTQREAAERAGLSIATYRQFERTGQISLERLLKVAFVLDTMDGFDALFPRPVPRSLFDVEQEAASRARKRGKRRNA
jgi:transcriptional regulator with XRE-family HTH domain